MQSSRPSKRSTLLPRNLSPPLHSPLKMTPQASWRSSRLHTLPSPHAGPRALAEAGWSCWQDMFTAAARAGLSAVSIGVRSGSMGVRQSCSKNAGSGEWENKRYSCTPNIRACLAYIVGNDYDSKICKKFSWKNPSRPSRQFLRIKGLAYLPPSMYEVLHLRCYIFSVIVRYIIVVVFIVVVMFSIFIFIVVVISLVVVVIFIVVIVIILALLKF